MAQPLLSQTACEHCGTLFSPQKSERFCCSGCEFVFDLIQVNGLGGFYRLRDASPPSCPVPAQISTANFDFCDDPEFIARMSPDGLRLRFYLEGLNCTACLWLLEKLPEFCSAAQSARINLSNSTIEIKRHANASFAEIARALNRLGYRPHAVRADESARDFRLLERRKELIRLGIAGAATGNIMIFAVSIYAGATGSLGEEFRWITAALASPVLTYCAWPFYRNTLAAIRARTLNIDVPIVAAILAGVAASLHGLINGGDTIYFDSLAMLVFLLLSSRFVLKGVQSKQFESTNFEDELLLSSVERLTSNGTFETVSSLSITPGDMIRISTERLIPADGIVRSGTGMISTAVLTGESEPIQVSQGASVEAGSRHLQGEWLLEVKATPAQSRMTRILRDTEETARSKSEFVHFADRVSNWFVTLVFVGAGLLVAVFAGSDPHEGISRALALVIVTCPCVFGVAIPLSMSFALRGAARDGIIVKNSDAIENLWGVRTLYFDKTGTLTTGEMSVLEVSTAHPEILGIALGLELTQSHPVARAIAKHLTNSGVLPVEVADVTLIPEGGIRGFVKDTEYSIKPMGSVSAQPDTPIANRQIKSSYGLYKRSDLVAAFQIGDSTKPEAPRLLKWARTKGFATRILSGDRSHVVEACAKQLGFDRKDCRSEASPESKADTVLACDGKTAMIGDGANDAAALATADVGIAVRGSLEASLRAADVYLVRSNLTAISTLFEIAAHTRRAIYRNLLFSASFNIISGTLAVCGWMTPLWAAVLMPLSSLTVLMSAVWTGQHLPKIETDVPE